MGETTVPSTRLWIERSLVPKKMVMRASITCDNPKNRMIDSISGLAEPCSRGTNTQYRSTPTIRKITNASGTANRGSILASVTTPNATNAPSIRKSPCARLTMRMTPNTRLRPIPTRLKYRPNRTPATSAEVSISASLPASGFRSAIASWTRIDRLAGGGFVRIDRDELDVAVIVERELPERRQFADLAAHLIESERTIERLQFSGQAEHRAAQFELIEAGRNRKRLLDDEPGGVSGNRIEAELDLAIGVFLVPGGFIILDVHAEIDRILQFRRRHIGENVLEALLADILFEKLGLEPGIDREQHFELDADIRDVAQKRNIVRRVAEMNHGVRLGVVDVVDDDGVVGGLGRNALIVDDLDRRAGVLDEFAERVGLGAGEFVGRIENGDLLDTKARPIAGDEVRNRLRPDGRDRVRHQRDIGIVLGEKAGAGSGLVEQEHLVIARDRHRGRGQHRAGVRDQEIDLILRNELVVERGSSRGVALIVVGDKLDRDFLVKRLHVDSDVGILLVDPEFQRAVNRHRNRGVAPG